MTPMTSAMFGPSSAPAMSRNTVSGTSLLGMSFATMGLAAAVSAMMASETRSEVMEVCAFR